MPFAGLPDVPETVAAWGGAIHARSWVRRPTTVDAIRSALGDATAAALPVALRGAGQSYGDAALVENGLTLDLSGMRRVIAWDSTSGVVEAEPGVTIAQLWRHVIADGWWPAVVPGTMAVSLGGGVAMNFHGKNNWRAGPIGDHVRALDLLLPSGALLTITRTARPDLFHAVIGGFGMLGIITRVELALTRIHSGLLEVEALSAPSLDGLFDVMRSRLDDAHYLVGWVDTLATGSRLGRGLVHAGYHLAPGTDPDPGHTLRPEAQELPPTILGLVPKSLVWRFMRPFMNTPGVRIVNALKYRQGAIAHGHRYRQAHAAFHFLLDYVPDWKRAYGPGGLIQFQSFVPDARAEATFRTLLTTAREAGLPPYLGVLKRHRPDAYLMTHAVDGWSLALDFAASGSRWTDLVALTRTLARVVVEAGGRFYPAKDATLDASTYQESIGADRLERFLVLKRECDPEGRLQTSLSQRLLPSLG